MYNELDSIYEGIYESYVNDYIIFEGILRRDYMECIGVLNEDGNKNFLKNIWEKILNLFDTIKMKIIKIITDFVSSIELIRESMSQSQTIIKMIKYIKYLNIEELNSFLSDFKIDNYRSFNPSITGKVIEKNKDIVNSLSFDDGIEEMRRKLDSIPSKEDIVKKIKELLWNKEYEENPFKDNIQSNINFIFNFLIKKHDDMFDIIDCKNSIIKQIENKKNQAKRIQRKYNSLANNIRYKEKDVENRSNNSNTKLITQKEEANVVDEIEDIELYNKKTSLYIKLLMSIKSFSLLFISSYCKELNLVHKETFRLYNSAGKHIYEKMKEDIKNNPERKKYYKKLFNDYNEDIKQRYKNKKQQSKQENFISDEYNNALYEATIYELEVI